MSQYESQPGPRGVASWHIFVLIAVIVLLAYRPTLRSDFVRLDDFQYVVDNELVRRPTLQGTVTFFGEIAKPSTVEGYYQPLTMVSFMLDSLIAGPSAGPLMFHFTSILLHAVNSFLVVLLLHRVIALHRGIPPGDEWADWAPALLAGMFFALHPVQVESVSWISQRKTVLATCFALGAMLQYLAYATRGGAARLGASVALYLLGTLAKPTIVLLPLVLPLLDRWPLRRSIAAHLPGKWPYAAIMLAMGWIAWSSQAAFNRALMVPNVGSLELAGKWVALLSYNFMLYLGNLLWPMHLSPFRAIPENLSLASPHILLSLTGTVAFVVIWLGSLRFSRPLFTGMSAFLLLLLPALGGLRFMGSSVADRFLYLPMIFLLLPLAVAIEAGDRFMRSRVREYRGVVALFALPMIVLTWGQQNVWADSKTLYSHVTQTAPRWYRGHSNMAQIYLEEENFDEAIASADRATTLNPGDGPSFIIKGRALIRRKRLDEGIAALEHALTLGLGPDEPEAWLSIAEGRALGGDMDGARAAIERSVGPGVSMGGGLTRVGDVVLRIGKQYERAAELLREAAARDPENFLARLYLANALAALGREQEALVEYEASIALQRKAGLDVSELARHVRSLREKNVPPASRPADDVRP